MLDKFDPEHKQYLIGFLQGDGSLSNGKGNKGKLTVEISDRDKDVIDWMVSLGWGCNIGEFNRLRDTNFSKDSSSIGFRICIKSIRDSIGKYVPVGRKSDTISVPMDISSDLVHHYLRGFLDADGSIGLTSLGIPFVSFATVSESLKNFILRDIKETIGFEMRINRNNRDNIFNITLFRENAVEYSRRLYNEASVYLNRKFEKYLEVQQQIRLVPKRLGVQKRQLSYEDLIVLSSDFSMEEKIKLLERTDKSIKTRIWRLTKSSNN